MSDSEEDDIVNIPDDVLDNVDEIEYSKGKKSKPPAKPDNKPANKPNPANNAGEYAESNFDANLIKFENTNEFPHSETISFKKISQPATNVQQLLTIGKGWITDALNVVVKQHSNHDIHKISTPLNCAGDVLKIPKGGWYYVLESMADEYCKLHDARDVVKNYFNMKSTSIAIRAPIPDAENRVLQVYTTTFEYKVGEIDGRFSRFTGSKMHQLVKVIFRVILSRGNDIFLYFSESAVEEKGSFANDLDDRKKIPLKTVLENPHKPSRSKILPSLLPKNLQPRKHATVKTLPLYRSTNVQLADAAMHDTTSTKEACEHRKRKMQAASKQHKNTCKAQQPDQQPEGPMKDKQQEYHTIFM